MPAAARVGDPTGHPGTIVGAGETTVLLAGQPAAVQGSIHECGMPPSSGPHSPTWIADGSGSVLIGGRAAARVGDKAACGSPIMSGTLKVIIGG